MPPLRTDRLPVRTRLVCTVCDIYESGPPDTTCFNCGRPMTEAYKHHTPTTPWWVHPMLAFINRGATP